MKKRVLYGVTNYAELVHDHGYFVDKTAYLERLEAVRNPVFLRPRRFGKSLLCSMLEYYYDIRYASRFDELFAHTWIGQHPTPQHNSRIVLSLDFSVIESGASNEAIEYNFKRICNARLAFLRDSHPTLLATMPAVLPDDSVSNNLSSLLSYLKARDLPPLYVIIDEYDNFANQLITGHRDHLYHELTTDDSFLKAFFKTLKEGRKTGAIANTFITGVLPITLDDLASAYNIATFLTLNPNFEAMLGFTQNEADHLLDEVYQDYAIDPATRSQVDAIIKSHYNGYHFTTPHGEALYNSTILMYFLNEFTQFRQIPEFLTDMNLRSDLSWVQRITSAHPGDTEAFVEQLTTQNQTAYDRTMLTTKFNASTFFQREFYPISFFYLGMLTRRDDYTLQLPNNNLRQIFVEYFNELNRIDVSTHYAELMSEFVQHPNLERLFAGYWEKYVAQLPEAIFQRVNENFYRTTFYELCSRYLSRYFTWNLERSYPQGRSDLEFVGKFHEKFADLRWVIEFKYYSNAEFKRRKVKLEHLELQAEDTDQIAGYAQAVHEEYPTARISQFVIYCIGNQGFRVFAVES
jgi:hypothetical protein